MVFNGEKYLEDTIKSVLNQSYTNWEYIIIDGGSTDGTINIIKKYEDKIDYWRSEKDNGIYDAMNKGIQLCTGHIIGLINADDWYNKNTLELISKNYKENRLIYGNLLTHFNSGRKYLHNIPIPKTKEEVRISAVHPTVFISKDLYKNLGLFDLTYKLAADYDMMIRMFIDGAEIVKIDEILANFREGGASANGAGALEGIEITKKHNFSEIALLKIKIIYYKSVIKNFIKKYAFFLINFKRKLTDYRY